MERGCRWMVCAARLRSAALLAVVALAPATSSTALAAGAAYTPRRVCADALPGRAACTAMRLVPAGARPAVTYREPFPGFLTAEALHAAYSLPGETASSTLQTVAVIDAFDDPTAEADLGVYDERFHLPACTTANGCFRKVNQEGQASPLPREEGEWASEASIDVQMAHAICQSCRVLLVEADDESFANLGTAVNAAVNAGATEISNSYAGQEEPAAAGVFTGYNSAYYDHPGVVLTASSGDCGYLNEGCLGKAGAANFPASSPDVVAVGGTTLTDGEGAWESTVWGEGGSGCSQIFAAPPWQSVVADFSATGCGEQRSVADVAAIGDPETGVDVYDSTPEYPGGPTGWGVWGGTSVSSPIVAAEFALAGGAHGVPYPAATLYSHAGEAGALYDVVSGGNGSCAEGDTSCRAAVGFDGPSGVGSPVGLSAFSTPGSPASTSTPTIAGAAEQGQTLTETAGTWTNSPTSLSEQWELCNASGGGCSAIASASGLSYTLTSGDVDSTIRVQETASNASGSGPPAASAQTATVAGDTLTLSITSFKPLSGRPGKSVTIKGTGFNASSTVSFDGVRASVKSVSANKLKVKVPAGAGTGPISVTNTSAPVGTVYSASSFKP
jgi:hypothetical protein